MLGNITFPQGVSWEINNKNLYDIYGEEYNPTTLKNAYQYSPSSIIRIKYGTSNVTDMSYMFTGCASLIEITPFDTSQVTNMSYMFNECKLLKNFPVLNTSNVTNMSRMFYYCSALVDAPQLDTSNVTNMSYMFAQCTKMIKAPQLDMGQVTDISNLYYYCDKLEEIPDCNCSKIKSFGSGSYNTWLYSATKIKKIGVIDCDSVTDIGYVLGNGNKNDLTDIGGFRNLGKASSVSNTNSNYFMMYAPNLTYESVMNVLNLLYDRAANGLSNLTLKLHANHMALLSEEDKLVAINKGWTLTS